jgi:hypothetical protein
MIKTILVKKSSINGKVSGRNSGYVRLKNVRTKEEILAPLYNPKDIKCDSVKKQIEDMRQVVGVEDFDFLIIKIKNDDRTGLLGVTPSMNDLEVAQV